MTRFVLVDDAGRLALGDQAERLGFVAGAAVEIIPTSAGSLLVVLHRELPAYDAPFRPLVGGGAQLAARRAREATG